MNPRTLRLSLSHSAHALRRSSRQPAFGLARTLLLCVGVVATLTLSASAAHSACDPDPPADGDAVSCTGTDETGFDGSGALNLTVNVEADAVVTDTEAAPGAAGGAILVGAGNTVTVDAAGQIDVTQDLGAGIRGGDSNNVTNEGAIVVDGMDAAGIDVGSIPLDETDLDPDPNPEVINRGTIALNGVGAVGIRTVDNYIVTNEAAGTITIESTAVGGVGISGADDNFITQNGTITIEAANAFGVQIDTRTIAPLPNGVVFDVDSMTFVNGNGSIALDVGDNVGTAFIATQERNIFGQPTGNLINPRATIELNGDNTIALQAGNKTEEDAQANHTNQGLITINGADAFGLKVGDGWIEYSGNGDSTPFEASAAGTRNQGTIDVVGDRSTAIFAGDESNVLFNHNSFVSNSGTINLTGTDSIGVNLGGNDFLTPWDLDDSDGNLAVFSFENTGTVTGGADTGALVLFRGFNAGGENRVLNAPDGSLLADLATGGVAIQGTDGDEAIFNLGAIRGDVLLMDGNDQYIVNSTQSYEGDTVSGGDGDDLVSLSFTNGNAVGVFDALPLTGFETLRIDGRDQASGATVGWTIQNGLSFENDAIIIAGGRLVAPANPDGTTAAVTLGGTLSIDPAGSVLLAPDGTAVPLTIAGVGTLAGTLIVEPTETFPVTAGTTRLVQVTGGIAGMTTFDTELLPTDLGLFEFATAYDANGIDLVATLGTFASAGSTSNNAAIGSYFDALRDPLNVGTATEITDVITELLTTNSNLNDFFDAVTPEPYDAQTTMIAESSRRISNLLFDRPRECTPGELDPWQSSTAPVECHARKLSAWSTAIGSIRKREENGGHAKYDAEMGGIVLGIDLESIGGVDLTVALTAQRGRINFSTAGESDLVLADLTGLASWSHGNLRLQGAASYGFGSHNDRRSFSFTDTTNSISGNAKEDHISHHIGLAAQAGYVFDLGVIDIEPLLGLDYVWITQDEISESDAGVWGLNIDERDDSVLSGTVGIRLSTVYQHSSYLSDGLLWMDGVWRPTVDFRWRQYLVGYERELSARFTGASDMAGNFEVEGEEDSGGFEVGAGVSFIPKNANRLQFDLRYDVFRSENTLEHDLVAKVRFGF
ncbi:MAG: autotransporter domain-containing protein [Myxococcota bacterium]